MAIKDTLTNFVNICPIPANVYILFMNAFRMMLYYIMYISFGTVLNLCRLYIIGYSEK